MLALVVLLALLAGTGWWFVLGRGTAVQTAVATAPGAGKTTLLKLIGGLDLPSSGSISIDGQRIDQRGAGALVGALPAWNAMRLNFVDALARR